MDDLPRTRLTGAFERRVRRALDEAVPAGEPLVVACSGGPDSTAALLSIAPSGRTVVAAQFDHGIRPAPDREADRAAVSALAQRLGIRALFGAHEGRPPEAEEAAREARYRWLASACAEAGTRYCITAHTLDDQAETVLLRLARGSGLRGLAGMPALGRWPVAVSGDAPLLVRPLLGIRRAEVTAYLAALAVEPRQDETNEDLRYARNRIRHRVVPELQAVNPRALDAVARFADLARLDEAALEDSARSAATSAVRLGEGVAEIQRGALRALPEAVALRVLRDAVEALGGVAESGQLGEVLRLARRRGARASLSGIEAEVANEVVTLRAMQPGGSQRD